MIAPCGAVIRSGLFNPVVQHLRNAQGSWHMVWPHPAICLCVPVIDAAFLIVEGQARETGTFN